jgi:DUF2075 family protein
LASRAYYDDSIDDFLGRSNEEVLGRLVQASPYSVEALQRDAWIEQIVILRAALGPFAGLGRVLFEFSIPRLGKRIDVVVVIQHVLFVIEFKAGETKFSASATDQVWDYGLDLKNFHETSHEVPVVPILIATQARPVEYEFKTSVQNDNLVVPIHVTPNGLSEAFRSALTFLKGPTIDGNRWEEGRYHPTPTIVEAAMALYGGHSVDEISRSGADGTNLSCTSKAIAAVIESSRANSKKSICLVTGVPGAGKTLVGLDIATNHIDKDSDLYSVFLSGNDPLVAVLREALARDKVRRERDAGRKIAKGTTLGEVKLFIQNVHHFRDDCLRDETKPPIEHVALFDEAQRAWNLAQTASFMRRKKGIADFSSSEPEFLISCLDRHPDWAVVVCLVGGGQEINVGEAGISEWIEALQRSFPDWDIHISPHLHDSEYGAGSVLKMLTDRPNVTWNKDLHLSVSMRSFRARHVSALVKAVLDIEEKEAARILKEVSNFPIVLTRDLQAAKSWLKQRARGTERYGIVVSSEAQRLRPHAIDVRAKTDPVHWFLGDKTDVRSSYYLEDVATEFQVQGLELDWACVVWDADFQFSIDGWKHRSFSGSKWKNIKAATSQAFLKNAYRVLLTRARQGMAIVVPKGDDEDPTRARHLYDPTYAYLARIGIPLLT